MLPSVRLQWWCLFFTTTSRLFCAIEEWCVETAPYERRRERCDRNTLGIEKPYNRVIVSGLGNDIETKEGL